MSSSNLHTTTLNPPFNTAIHLSTTETASIYIYTSSPLKESGVNENPIALYPTCKSIYFNWSYIKTSANLGGITTKSQGTASLNNLDYCYSVIF